MDLFLNYLIYSFSVFILIFIRATGIFVVAPFFSRNSIPMIAKIGLSLFLAFILSPGIIPSTLINIDSYLQLAFYGFNEFVIGIIIGFIGFIYFSTLYLAGTIIDTQMGFGMVNVMDPQTNSQIPIMGSFYNILFTLIFLAINGHHFIIRSLVYSYNVLPIGGSPVFNEELTLHITAVMTEVFIFSIKLGAPILATILIANVLLGVLARSMPQMNVFIVGMPLKIGVGLVTTLITLQYLIPFSEKLFDRMFNSILIVLEILVKG